MTENYLEHKGFISRIHFSEEDGVFYGEIESMSHLISFEGNNEIEVKAAFEEAVNNYVEGVLNSATH